MANFINSMQKGMKAAENAEIARAEVSSLFSELNRQLKEGLGKYILKIETRYKEPKSKANTVATPFGRGGVIGSISRSKFIDLSALDSKPSENATPYQALLLVGNNKEWELAEWRQDTAGYPCRIDNEYIHLICEDKRGLERGFESLLSSPTVGAYLIQAKQLQTKADEDVEK